MLRQTIPCDHAWTEAVNGLTINNKAMKILIIDDERAIRNSLKEILMDEGYEADTAEDGTQGVEMALKEKYSVIFCDIKMPNMDGIEVLDRLGAEGVDSAVIMISGHGDIDTAVECIKKGAFDFIQKPLDLNRILITIKNATDKVTLISKTERLASETNSSFRRRQMAHTGSPTAFCP